MSLLTIVQLSASVYVVLARVLSHHFLQLIGKSFLTVSLFHLSLLLGTGILNASHFTGLLKAEYGLLGNGR